VKKRGLMSCYKIVSVPKEARVHTCKLPRVGKFIEGTIISVECDLWNCTEPHYWQKVCGYAGYGNFYSHWEPTSLPPVGPPPTGPSGGSGAAHARH